MMTNCSTGNGQSSAYHSITLTLPPDVAAPKYKLFQQVYYGKQQGTIIAMRYVCPIEALYESRKYWGWQYDLSYLYGKTPQQALEAEETTTGIYEDSLTAVYFGDYEQEVG